jgi:hypothetical protein
MVLAQRVYQNLFKEKSLGFLYRDKFIRTNFFGGVKSITIGDYLFIEQNPRTGSIWAARANAGAKIMWIIKRSNRKYVGRVDKFGVHKFEFPSPPKKFSKGKNNEL